MPISSLDDKIREKARKEWADKVRHTFQPVLDLCGVDGVFRAQPILDTDRANDAKANKLNTIEIMHRVIGTVIEAGYAQAEAIAVDAFMKKVEELTALQGDTSSVQQ